MKRWEKVLFYRNLRLLHEGQCDRHGRRCDYRWGIRKNRLLHCGRCDYAPIGLLVGGVNFTDLKWVLKPAEMVDGKEIAAVTLNYGNFLQVTFDFLIIAFSIFMFIKLLTKLTEKKKEEAPAAPPAPPAPSKEEVLLTEIRDLLKEK